LRGQKKVNPRVEIACGLDVHRSKIVGAILQSDGRKETRTFMTGIDDAIALKDWILKNHCERVAMEATGIYWYPIYDLLEDHVTLQVVNPYFIKVMPGRKTDQMDAEWIAELCLNGMVKSSYVPPPPLRNRRDMVRTLDRLIRTRTRHKNRIHKIMIRSGIRIASHLSDLFGPSGLKILYGILEGRSIDTVLDDMNNVRITKKRDELRRSICGQLDEHAVYLIRLELDAIQSLNRLINDLKQQISILMTSDADSIEILMSIPGIGYDSAVNILGEIGDIHQFPTGRDLVSWAGLAPGMNESAGKRIPGHITKRGSKFLRTFLIEPAHSIAGMKRDNQLKRFFLRMRYKIGYKPAIIALARKLLMLIHHLLTHHELYHEDDFPEKKLRLPKNIAPKNLNPNDILDIISAAVSSLNETDRGKFIRNLNRITG
jgi:transposase